MQSSVLICTILAATLTAVVADTPANCTFEDIQGAWTFHEGERNSDSSIKCDHFKGPTIHTMKFNLNFPNVAVDEFGNRGYWTIIYNQGFEVVINNRKYFAFSKYKELEDSMVTSYCGRVMPGWSHDVLGKNWACYDATKNKRVKPKTHENSVLKMMGQSFFQTNKKFVETINKDQDFWRATSYPDLETMSWEDLIRRSGGMKSQIYSRPKASNVLLHARKFFQKIPEKFDWRNVSGVNYVTPVRNQALCGSCYSFSSLAMIESRLRIATNNSLKLIFSPQDIVSCSEYSQGCEGGFPYLIAGKYAQDFGVVPEECFPYKGKDGECVEKKKCKRYYVADYYYVGGYFGACNEDEMKLELVNNGPMAVAFEVFPDFQFYKSGIYHHISSRSIKSRRRFNPFILVSHAVLLVGYGVDDKTGRKYWIVKNSYGPEWGEDGYFRIRRGNNECGIESIAVGVIPIP